MRDPNVRARVSQLHKTEAAWNMLQDFTPICGEVVVFDPDAAHPFARLKIGDGVSKLQDLPFFVDYIIADYFYDHKLDVVIDAGRISEYKK